MAVANRFAGFGDNGGVPQVRVAKPKNPTPADFLADVVFSQILNREAELMEEAEAGLAVQDQLDVVRAPLKNDDTVGLRGEVSIGAFVPALAPHRIVLTDFEEPWGVTAPSTTLPCFD
jgi:hypothetical protein